MKFIFDEIKNLKLKETRGVNFEDVIFALMQGKLLEITHHPNIKKYAHQKMMILEIKGYAWQVPFIEENDRYVLKTVYPSRKATAKYLIQQEK